MREVLKNGPEVKRLEVAYFDWDAGEIRSRPVRGLEGDRWGDFFQYLATGHRSYEARAEAAPQGPPAGREANVNLEVDRGT